MDQPRHAHALHGDQSGRVPPRRHDAAGDPGAARRRCTTSKTRRRCSSCAPCARSARPTSSSTPTSSTDIDVRITNNSKEGNIPFGGTFGFSNAVELPVPIDTDTTDLQTALEWGNQRGMLRVGWDGSTFDNKIDAMIWDNPLRYGPDIAGTPSQGPHVVVARQHPDVSARHRRDQPARPVAPHRLHGALARAAATRRCCRSPSTRRSSQSRSSGPRRGREPDDEHRRSPSRRVRCRYWPSTRKYRYSDVDIQTPIFERAGGAVGYDRQLPVPRCRPPNTTT